MKKFLIFSGLIFIFARCNPFSAPGEVDWKVEWKKNHFSLERLKNDILKQGERKYRTGNNEFPKDFEYPFDEGFYINSLNGHTQIDQKKVTITFYMDRGLMDHYSAIVFTNDSIVLKEMEENVQNAGNDFKIKANWYAIND